MGQISMEITRLHGSLLSGNQHSLLLVTADFSLGAFVLAFSGAVLGIVSLSAAITNWLRGPLLRIERALLTLAALLMIAPELISTLIGVAILGLITLRQVLAGRDVPAAPTL